MKNNPMHLHIICGSKTRLNQPCLSKPIRGKKRCRMHGGTNPGAPKGNKNALKHGLTTRENLMNKKRTNRAIKSLKELMDRINQFINS